MRLRTKSLIIAACQGVSQLSALFIAVVLVRLISQETFGTYRQVFLVVTILSSLFSLPISGSLYYFLPRYGKNLWRNFLKQSVLFALAGACLVGAAMWLTAGLLAAWFANPPLKHLLRLFICYPMAMALMQIIPAYLVSVDRTLRAGVYSSIDAITRFGMVVTCFLWGLDLAGVLIGLTIASLVVTIVGCIDVWYLSRPEELVQSEAGFVLAQLNYSWPLWATAVVGVINLNLDKVLISYYFTPEFFAVFSCGAFEIPVVVLVTHSINQAILPDVVQHLSTGASERAVDLWQEGVRKSSLVLFPVFVVLMVVSREFITLLYGQGYQDAIWPFRIYLLLMPLRVAVYATLLQAMARTRVIAVGAGLALTLNVALSVGLLYAGRGGVLSFVGPCVGTVVAQFFLVAYLLISIRKHLNIHISHLMRWGELGRLMGLCLVSGLAAWQVQFLGFGNGTTIFIKVFVCCGVLFLLLLRTGYFVTDERNMLARLFNHRGLRWLSQ